MPASVARTLPSVGFSLFGHLILSVGFLAFLEVPRAALIWRQGLPEEAKQKRRGTSFRCALEGAGQKKETPRLYSLGRHFLKLWHRNKQMVSDAKE